VNQNRWMMLSLLFAARAVMGFQFQTVVSTGPSLIRSLGIDSGQLGLLIGFYLLPNLPALPNGTIGRRFCTRHIALAGLALMATGGVIIGTIPDFTTAAAGRLISGTGSVLLNVMLARLVADWFGDHKMTTAMGILVSSWALGIALGLTFDCSIAARFGWPAVQLVSAGLALVTLLLMATLYRDPP
jgi:predicted MFS family arabinose efflux permease